MGSSTRLDYIRKILEAKLNGDPASLAQPRESSVQYPRKDNTYCYLEYTPRSEHQTSPIPAKPLKASKTSPSDIPEPPLKCFSKPLPTTKPILEPTKTFLYPRLSDESRNTREPQPGSQNLEEASSSKRETAASLEQGGGSEVYAEVVDKLVTSKSKGVLIERRHDIFFSLNPKEECQETFRLPIPEGDLQEDSLYAYVTGGTDIQKGVVENLEKFLQTPEGCGVKNLTMLAENYLVLDYLQSICCLSPEARDRALRNLRSGYKRQLTFKRSDGSFSPHGERDLHGSTWLTAYVLTVFQQVSNYIDVDRHIREEGINFLRSKQEANGSFREDSCLFEMTNINDVGLTAYVVLVMLAADCEKTCRHIAKALTYIRQNRAACESEQSAAIAAYVLNMVSFQQKEAALAMVKSPFVSWHCEPIDSEAENSLDDLLTFAREVANNGEGEYEVILWDTASAKRLGFLNVNRCITQEMGEIKLPKRTREIMYEVKGYGRGWFRICYGYSILPQSDRPCFQLIN